MKLLVVVCGLLHSLLSTCFASGTLEAAPNPCDGPIIPGVATMAHGVDLTILDLTPNSNEDGNQTLPLFEFTCIKNHIWRKYNCPDQVETFTLLDPSAPKLSSFIGNGSAYFRERRCQQVGLENECSVGAFYQSDSFQEIETQMYQLKKAIAEVSHQLIVPFSLPTQIHMSLLS